MYLKISLLNLSTNWGLSEPICVFWKHFESRGTSVLCRAFGIFLKLIVGVGWQLLTSLVFLLRFFNFSILAFLIFWAAGEMIKFLLRSLFYFFLMCFLSLFILYFCSLRFSEPSLIVLASFFFRTKLLFTFLTFFLTTSKFCTDFTAPCFKNWVKVMLIGLLGFPTATFCSAWTCLVLRLWVLSPRTNSTLVVVVLC